MYSASNAFHTAVQNGNRQKAMLIFSDAVFTNEDLDIDAGITFHEYFNTEDDLAIGQMLSNEISFALFNDYGDLNSYEFGEFTATIGVQLSQTTYTKSGNCMAKYGNDTYIGYSSSPYITKNGTAMSNQPNFAVKSILVVDGTVYAFGDNGACRRWVNGSGATFTLNAFMRRKAAKWAGKGYSYNSTTRIEIDRIDGKEYRYEFVPLGVFKADRPNVPDELRIEFTCHDRMQKLEADMPDPAGLNMTYPATVGTLFTKICTKFGIPYETATFINSGATITAEPEEFQNATARTVMGWIAEAAGSNARFNREGQLVLDWVHNGGVEMDESGYVSFRPYWYETTTVSKLENRSNGEEEDKTYGSGSITYLIQDNPILKGFS